MELDREAEHPNQFVEFFAWRRGGNIYADIPARLTVTDQVIEEAVMIVI